MTTAETSVRSALARGIVREASSARGRAMALSVRAIFKGFKGISSFMGNGHKEMRNAGGAHHHGRPHLRCSHKNYVIIGMVKVSRQYKKFLPYRQNFFNAKEGSDLRG